MVKTACCDAIRSSCLGNRSFLHVICRAAGRYMSVNYDKAGNDVSSLIS